MGILPGQTSLSGDTDVTAENADSAGATELLKPTAGLPTRTACHHLPLPRFRFMDDTEILERVLEGLINLT